METSDDIAAPLSPLEQRRAALRALSDEIMETIKTLPKPQSWLEGDRAMRCLGTADRVTIQLFSKVKAPKSAPRPVAPVRIPEPEAPFVYVYDDDGVDDAEDTDGGAALDAALDDMETLLDAIDRGETPPPVKQPATPTATSPNTPYHNLAQTFARGRDLLTQLATPTLNTASASP
ncbi:MAG: hypothetical protein NVV72_06525 [Asticcacaulis sp.]|nr:hypothetical protein [Asticcacaulis sp.]